LFDTKSNSSLVRYPQLFVRDKLTWLGYLLVGYSCFVCAAFGPMMPFLRAEQELVYSVAALHFSAMATGGLITGTTGDRIMRRFGSASCIWGGAIGILCGLIILGVAKLAPITIFGALLIGFSSSLMGQTVTAIMSSRFGALRSIGIYECNIIGSVFCALAPFVVGQVSQHGLNWRTTLLFPIAYIAVVAATNLRTVTGSTSALEVPVSDSRLPKAYWAYFIVIALSVAAEWSVIFWSSEFMEHCTHFSKPDAATSVSVFLVAMFVGRIIGSRLTRVIPLRRMLPAAAVLAAAGFIVFWLGQSAPVTLLGLMLVGLGEANVYPLTFSAAIGTVPDQSARAAARMSISTGAAILIAPLILGIIADHAGLPTAFGFIAALLILAAVGVFIANALAGQHQADVSAGVSSQPAGADS
jgi:fucose permease